MSEKLKKEYTDDELVAIAIKRIKIKRSLYTHIAAYVFVNLFLVFIYFMTDYSGYNYNQMPWFIWVLACWGLGLLFHISNTIQELHFKYNTRMLNKELDKIKHLILE